MSQNSATKPRSGKSKKYMLVRYGRMNILALFEHNQSNIPRRPAHVVVKTGRGLELGQVVGQSCPYKGRQFRMDHEQIKEYFDKSRVEYDCEIAGNVVRYATPEDISEEKHLQIIAEEELQCCKNFAEELNLPMKIVNVEHIFGGERIIFYFMSEGRVDFRELVKKVAHEYQTRVEMRQVGSRDEAKLLGDVESCGQQCCCQRFLKVLKPVNMRMAKMQKATLDPSKISGYCGRLKCCLRYEDLAYTELKKRLPKKNTRVKTPHGYGRVIDSQILAQLLMIEYDDGTRQAVALEEVEIVPHVEKKQQQSNSTADKKNNNRRKGPKQ
jgi:cell fate regulator YaaT (PSP1 superfamily)